MQRINRFLLGIAIVFNFFGLAPSAWAAYTLDFGDSVVINIRDVPQYSGTFPLQPDGMIVIPHLDEFLVRGLSVKQVQERVTRRLSAVIHNPQVSVVIGAFRPRTVTVLGEVGSPGVVVLSSPDQRVIDTIAAAGGFTDRALRYDVVILRGDGPNAKRIPINVEAMMESGDLTNNIRLEPGDRLQVGRNPWPSWREVFTATQMVAGFVGTVSLLLVLLQRWSGNAP